jgi:PAS domain S-box-containing protein
MANEAEPVDDRELSDLSATTDQVVSIMRSHDWSQTVVGVPETWPDTLRTMVEVLLGSRFSMWMAWGEDLSFFYNDAYRRDTLGVKHPWALGRPAREVWAEIWDEIGPRIETVLATGVATWDEGLQLFLERSGFREETYHTFSYSPIRELDGSVVGMLCVVSEDTDRVISERRLTTLRDLGAALAATATEEEVHRAVHVCLEEHQADLPFALLYRMDEDGRAQLVSARGVPDGHVAAPATIDPATSALWPLTGVLQGETVIVDDLDRRLDRPLPSDVWEDPTRAAVLVPLAQQGQLEPAGFFVAGLNPYCALDEPYLGFITLFAGQVAAGLASARSFEAERRRAEALAELDRAKTEFFSNVSHEFRTPLTLITGPAADSLADTVEPLPPGQRQRVEMINRNAARLRRLVNDLLDFARLEGGGLEPQVRPADVAVLTADVATSFASVVERAGLRLEIDCPPLGREAYVDTELWERIVLNLVSNAFKFTLEGVITVAVRAEGDEVVLTVADSGVGIPADQVPLLFQRFHRVASTRGRSHEGTGVGLALVAELAALHGGEASVTSVEGEGSTFTVRIPFGEPGKAMDPDTPRDTVRAAHVDEARQWGDPGRAGDLAGTTGDAAAGATTAAVDGEVQAGLAGELQGGAEPHDPADACVLVVDDNADLRSYLVRTLEPHWRVVAAADGRAALELVQRERPDLVLSDVMMPALDGFELLAALRSDPQTATIPIILLSARAGEEASVEGLQAGADDYLVKPFSALDLVARVRSNLDLARFRNAEAERRKALVESLDEGVTISDVAGTVLEANPAFQRILGYDHRATPYPVPHPWFPDAERDPERRAELDRILGETWNGGHGRGTMPMVHADGRHLYIDMSFAPVVDQGRRLIVTSFRDVTAEMAAADRQAALTRLGVGLARATGQREVCDTTLVELRSLFGARSAVVLLGDLDDPVVVSSPPGTAAPAGGWREVVERTRVKARAHGTDDAHRVRDALVATALELEHPATVWVELDAARVVSDDEVVLFRLVCQHMGQALHRAHLFDEQREVATAMQRAILGPTRTPPGVAVRYVPAVRPLEVGGDWYDIIEGPADSFGIIVGDCVGKGLAAATVMGQLRTAGRALFLQNPDPAGVLASLDTFARQIPGAECTTAVCAVVDRRSGTVTYSSAGHVPGVIVHADGAHEILEGARSSPLASLVGERTNAVVLIDDGARLVFCTDGLIERRGEVLDVGVARLVTAVAAGTGDEEHTADHVLASLLDAQHQRDDVALVLYEARASLDLRLTLAARPTELEKMRHALRRWLTAEGVGESQADDVLLACSEAAANAMEHAYASAAGGTLEVSAFAEDGTIVVEVSDRGAWRVPDENDTIGGRGLHIMRSVMDEVEIQRGPDGTRVRMALAQAPSGG